jgi:hypothetical protein
MKLNFSPVKSLLCKKARFFAKVLFEKCAFYGLDGAGVGTGTCPKSGPEPEPEQ